MIYILLIILISWFLIKREPEVKFRKDDKVIDFVANKFILKDV